MSAFIGGIKMRKYLEGITAQLKGQVDIGFMKDAKYPNGTSVAQVAFWNEFGTSTIPPRPFFRNMIKEEAPKLCGMIARGFKAGQSNKEMLGIVGEEIAGALQESIRDTNSPGLSPITLMLRKMKKGDRFKKITGVMVGEAAARVAAGESYAGVSTKPLIDTAQLLDAVTYRVRE